MVRERAGPLLSAYVQCMHCSPCPVPLVAHTDLTIAAIRRRCLLLAANCNKKRNVGLRSEDLDLLAEDVADLLDQGALQSAAALTTAHIADA